MKNIKKGAVALLLFAICGNSAVFARKPLTAAEKARYQKYAVDLFIESRKKEQKVIEKAGNKSESIPVALSEVIVTHQKDEEVKPIVVFPVDSKRSSAILLDIDVDSKQELCVADLESDLTESSDEAIKQQVKKSKPVRFYRIKPSVEKIVFEDVKKLETKYSVLGRKGAEYAVGEALDDLLEKANEALKKSCDDKSVNTLFCEAMGVLQLFLDPASDQDISRYLTQKDIQILKGTGDKLLAEGLDYSFVRFVSDCNQQKLTSAQFKDEIIAEYGVDISNSAHRGANLKNEAVYGALLDIFSFLCE